MKQFTLFLSIFLLLSELAAQAPLKFNYQAAIRDGSGILAYATMDIRISILDQGASGIVLYQEVHQSKQSDQFGLINLRIGEGMPVTGNMAGIAWGSGSKFLRIETNYGGSGSYQPVGQPVPLVSVPFALYAEQSGNGGSTNYSAGAGINISPNNVITNTGDADNDPTNEKQTLDINGFQISISGGNAIILPSYTPGGGISISPSNVISNTGDADSSPTNEIQTINLNGNQLSLSNGGGSVTLPTGTIYSAGTGISISGNTISAADPSSSNEIQALSISGTQLSLSNGGGSVTLPTGTTYSAGTGISISGNTISNTGDNDNDPNNEKQSLSVNGNQLTISGSNTVTLPSGSTYSAGNGITISGTTISSSTWQKSGTDVYYNGGNTGIGTSSPTQDLTIKTEILGLNAAGNDAYRIGDLPNGGGYFYTYGPNQNRNVTLSSLQNSPDNGFVGVLDADGVLKGVMTVQSGNYGFYSTSGANGNTNTRLTSHSSSTNHGYIGVYDANGNVKAGMYVDANGNGVLFKDLDNFRMPHPTQPGKDIWYACIEGPEAAAYCRGTGTLTNGAGIVHFTEDFSIVANATTMTVMLTPLSGDSKGLAVIEKTAEGFKVKELLGGTGNYAFDWEVKAVRKGHENYRVIRDANECQPAAVEKNEGK